MPSSPPPRSKGGSARKAAPPSRLLHALLMCVAAGLAIWFSSARWRQKPVEIRADQKASYIRNVTCLSEIFNGNCARIIVDGIFEDDDITSLKSIAEKGMALRERRGGPTILDLNTGYLRDTIGLVNLFTSDEYRGVFMKSDFELYDKMIRKLKFHVGSAFGVSNVFFTAPTFITRLDGNKSWAPQSTNEISFLFLKPAF